MRKKIILVFLLLCININSFSHSIEELKKNICITVFLDYFGVKKIDSFDVEYKKMKIESIKANGIFRSECEFFKIELNNGKDKYYVAYLKFFKNCLYKLKGFRNSDFLYFYNSFLFEKALSSKKELNYKKKRKIKKWIFNNISISELDIKKMYKYYISDINRSKNYIQDSNSCFEKKFIRAY